jgi:hypothetical protein
MAVVARANPKAVDVRVSEEREILIEEISSILPNFSSLPF